MLPETVLGKVCGKFPYSLDGLAQRNLIPHHHEPSLAAEHLNGLQVERQCGHLDYCRSPVGAL